MLETIIAAAKTATMNINPVKICSGYMAT